MLKEYEYFLSGNSAHRNCNFEIEHFFPLSWREPRYHSHVTTYGFTGCEEYKQSFVDQIGNKCVLDRQLNNAIKNQDPVNRISAYSTHSWGKVHVMNKNPSYSALEIKKDLSSSSKDIYIIYIKLRSLRIAAFAATRF